jgi:hypothetical protein
MDETLLQSNEEGKSNINIDITCNTSLAGHWSRRIEAFLIRLGMPCLKSVCLLQGIRQTVMKFFIPGKSATIQKDCLTIGWVKSISMLTRPY